MLIVPISDQESANRRAPQLLALRELPPVLDFRLEPLLGQSELARLQLSPNDHVGARSEDHIGKPGGSPRRSCGSQQWQEPKCKAVRCHSDSINRQPLGGGEFLGVHRPPEDEYSLLADSDFTGGNVMSGTETATRPQQTSRARRYSMTTEAETRKKAARCTDQSVSTDEFPPWSRPTTRDSGPSAPTFSQAVTGNRR